MQRPDPWRLRPHLSESVPRGSRPVVLRVFVPRRGALVACLTVALLIVSGLPHARGEPRGRGEPVRIGVLTASWGPPPIAVGLRDGLVELGYRENKDFVIGVRFTRGSTAELPEAARDLVRTGAELILAGGANSAQAARSATRRIPIVFAGPIGDPVKLGLVQSVARPGENVTGVTDLDLELGPKRLEIFREVIPGLERVLLPYDSTDPYTAEAVQGYRRAAHRLGIVLVERRLGSEAEARTVLLGLRQGGVDGILAPSLISLNIPGFILEAASRQGIPAMFGTAFWVEEGGLLSYGPDFYASGHQAARLVDKILKGAEPGALPVEGNPRIELAINEKAARGLGVEIPPLMLYRADRVVR